jgi:hypothetical protein
LDQAATAALKGGEKMASDFRKELRKITFEPAKQLVEMLEKNYDKLDIQQKKDLEKLKFGLIMFQLEELEEQQEKDTKGGFRWA